MLLLEGLLDFLSGIHVVSHVDLIEGGQTGIGVLGLLQTTSDGLSHSVHLDASLKPGSRDL